MKAAKLVTALSAWLSLASICHAQEAEQDPAEYLRELADGGYVSEYGRNAKWLLDDHRKMNASISALAPQRPGVVDAYVIAVGLDSDAVFGNEASEGARVLSRRYDAEDRTILLAAGSGAASDKAANGSPQNLAIAISAIAATMDPKEDVLVLFSTSHGSAEGGLAYRDQDFANGMIGPNRLKDLLDSSGIERRMIIISACYSGIFVPALQTDSTVVITAASSRTTSFGCAADNDWTFFGDALLNNAMRTNDTLKIAARKAFGLISAWEKRERISASRPQLFIGKETAAWLEPLELRTPTDTSQRVGRPARSR
jgi:Peptidase C13 family